MFKGASRRADLEIVILKGTSISNWEHHVMLSGKNREAAREALQLKVQAADIHWLRATYEEMCGDQRIEVDESIMDDEDALRNEWAIIVKRTQYATCLF